MNTETTSSTMMAARLHGPRDIRIEEVPHPGQPGPGEVLLRVTAVGICGSDLHTFEDGRIGDTVVEEPLIMGHEFGAVIVAVGDDALDGNHEPLVVGARVAVDPAQPCGTCEMCELGHPNLCGNVHFCGTYPDQGSLCDYMIMPSETCFPIPDTIDDIGAAMLEPLGVAIHAVDLAKIRVGDSVAILGGGPIGHFIQQLVKLTGADPIFVSDKFDWRLDMAEEFGAIPINCDKVDPVEAVMEATGGRGVDVAIEAAWADHSIQQAAAMARLGGRLVLVGIPGPDKFEMQHSTARRKGLTIRMARRMKHVYPRGIHLAKIGAVDLNSVASHCVPLAKTPDMYAMNADYADNVMKIIVEVSKS